MRLILCILLACALSIILGCSSGENAPMGSTPQRTGRAAITIHWPTRAAGTRTFVPNATQSIIITLGNNSGYSVSQMIDRSSNATSINYTFTGVPDGSIAVCVQAFDGHGTLLASGTSLALITDGQTTTLNAEMDSDVASVTLVAPPFPESGQTIPLLAKVSNTQQSIILEQPGSIYWSSSDSTIATVDQDGNVTCVKAGTVTITAQERESGISGTIQLTVQ